VKANREVLTGLCQTREPPLGNPLVKVKEHPRITPPDSKVKPNEPKGTREVSASARTSNRGEQGEKSPEKKSYPKG